jgi:hypothetical protein
MALASPNVTTPGPDCLLHVVWTSASITGASSSITVPSSMVDAGEVMV